MSWRHDALVVASVFTPGGSRIGSRADADVVDLEAPENDDPSIVEPIELAASAA
jgi:hypothetical protein